MTFSSPINAWIKSKHITAEQFLDQLDTTPRGTLARLNAIEDAIREGIVIESLGQRSRAIVLEDKLRGLIKHAPVEPSPSMPVRDAS